MNETTAKTDGSLSLVADGSSAAINRIGEFHRAVANIPFALFKNIPLTRQGAQAVEVIESGITNTVYRSIGRSTDLAIKALRLANRLHNGNNLPSHPAGAHIHSAINGICGDYLEEQSNPLSLDMAFYQEGKKLELDSIAAQHVQSDSNNSVVIFIHGLCCNELSWRNYSEHYWDEANTDFGQRLTHELGSHCLYLRYNTGLPLIDNGRQLNHLIQQLSHHYPQPIDEITLVGHSMGGLIAHCAHQEGIHNAWTKDCLKQIVTIGSPLTGAPLAKAGRIAAEQLQKLELTAPLAKTLERSSAGIKDLEHGYFDMPESNVTYSFIGSSLWQDTEHPLSDIIGDSLVPVSSAAPDRRFRHKLLGNVNHMQLQNHPEVYQQLQQWLR